MKIATQIFLAIALTSLISVLAVHAIQRYHFEQNFIAYVQQSHIERLAPVIEALQNDYKAHGNWQHQQDARMIDLNYRALARQLVQNRPPRFNRASSRDDNRDNNKKRLGRLFRHLTLLDAQEQWLAGADIHPEGLQSALYDDDRLIGYLHVAPPKQLERRLDREFAKHHDNSMLYSSIAVIFLASFSALLLSRHLSGPIKRLSEGVSQLTEGNYSGQLDIKRRDELGQLAQAFDRLTQALDASRESQRQWISDIAHELRTPVTILGGEIECLEDGLTPLTLEAIGSLKHETQRLKRLIEDLHQLSQADAGQLNLSLCEVNPTEELTQLLHRYAEPFNQHNITLDLTLPDLGFVMADRFRLEQVFSNILANSLRYTDSPGKLAITAKLNDQITEKTTKASTQHTAQNLTLTFSDSKPGVSKQELSAIFKRLYRTDSSRSRKTGAAGLGLAICQAIIDEHGGKIYAEHSSLGGLSIVITLPLHKKTEDSGFDKTV